MSAAKIAKYFSEAPTSNNAYCILAVPLKYGVPPFCLCMFGTDNKFTAIDVYKRFEWTIAALAEGGITVLGTSSDGYSRLLKCMRIKTFESNAPSTWVWFYADKHVSVVFVQDHIHIGTKLKCCFLKPSVILPMGKEHSVSRGHLVELIRNVRKDQHELRESHINPKDKMNHRSVQKMSSEKVISLLRSEVPKSEATVLYLEMMREVVESYARPDLAPLTRVEMLWKWVHFLRIWRSWIEKEEEYSVVNNFITLNAYTCIEINAHALIQTIIKLRDTENHSLFLPFLMDSQAAEHLFRRLRSSTASNCGVVPFSILELQNHFRRLDLLTRTQSNLRKKFTLPRHHKAASEYTQEPHIPVCLPEDFEIERAVTTGLQKALALAKKFKLIPLNTAPLFVPKCHVNIMDESAFDLAGDETEDPDDINIDAATPDVGSDVDDADSDKDQDRENIEDDVVEDLYMASTRALCVKKFNNAPLNEDSPFVLVSDGYGHPQIIRKQSFCWLLSSGDTKISSDRLVRVSSELFNHSKPRHVKNLPLPTVEEKINVGDWCAFSENKTVVIGVVLSFSYLSGSTLKNQEYRFLSAPSKPPQENARGLGCLCSWFPLKNSSRVLQCMQMDLHGFYSLDYYICTIPRPQFSNGKLHLSCNVKDILRLKK